MLWEFLPLSCSQRARWLLLWARRRTVFGLAATRTDPYSPNPKTRLERLPSDRSKIGIGSERGTYDRHAESNAAIIRSRYRQSPREGPPTGNSFHDGYDGSRLGASDFVSFGGGTCGRNIFSCNEIRPAQSQWI